LFRQAARISLLVLEVADLVLVPSTDSTVSALAAAGTSFVLVSVDMIQSKVILIINVETTVPRWPSVLLKQRRWR
jgi:hypothetical protein